MTVSPQETVAVPPFPVRARLLIVATVPEPIRNFLLPYSDHFRGLGWTVDVATSEPHRYPEIVGHFDHVHEIPWSRSIANPRNIVVAAPAVRGLVRRTQPHILHVHTPIAGFVTRAAVRSLPARERPAVVYTTHGFHFHREGSAVTNSIFLMAERIAGRWTDRLVVINDEDEHAALASRIVPPHSLVRMPGIGIDLGHYDRSVLSDEAIAAARRSAGVPADAPMFVMVGELRHAKRPTDAVRALAAMTRRNAHVVFVGEGILRTELVGLATTLHVEDRTHFTGFVSDIRPFVASAIATVLPSSREGLSRALMESLCLSVPAIASDARGNSEVVGKDAGVIFPVGDVAALARAMDRLATDPQERDRLAASGRTRMESQYALPHLISRHEELYSSLLADRAVS